MSTSSANEPVSPQNTVQQLLVYQLLWMLLLRVILYTLILGVSFYLQSGQFNVLIPPTSLLTVFILLVYTTTIISGFLLLGSVKDPRHFGFKQNLLDTVFVSILIYYTGASHSIFSPIYFFPIIAGGLIMPRLGGLIAAGAATLQYALVLTLEYYRIFPEFLKVPYNFTYNIDLLTSINLFAVYGLTFFLAAILSSLFAGRLRTTEDALSDSVRSFDQLSLLYKQIFDDIATGIITTNDKNRITSANNAAGHITGYSPEELLKKDFHQIFSEVDLNDKGSRHSAGLQRKNGDRIQIGYSYTNLQYDQGKDNTPDFDKATCNNCKVVTIQDISEVERLERQMQQAEKLAAIGRMSAGIAHDFRNPLTAISGSAQVLANEFSLMDTPQQQTNLDLITIILRESNRLDNTISDFLKFARPEHAEKEWFSFKRCLKEVIEVAQADPAWPTSCTLDIRIGEPFDVWADEYQLFTLLNHIFQNALAFCPKGKEKILIETKEEKNSEQQEGFLLTIEDNGPGISPGKEDKIFEPFYTRRLDGTGLGLAIVKQIVDGHQGSIEVGRSTLGGAKFTVFFPLP
ncbi:MAG: PAS domain S-box protein [Proteobacteria bacterium]|nr:PAS domain S-box protein [Pseudomonadota bacterium]MBU1420443.1 PAS domain S-box protein [Pseudomonadota bacterium]MBU1456354.1 PAS domain S-box protein [Pseudomonadota bacterium]